MSLCLREPDRITAGESLAWSIALPEYPASEGWVLKYSLQLGGKDPLTITAAGEGVLFTVSVAASVTVVWPPGAYALTAFAENAEADARKMLRRATLSILPGPLAALGQSHAEQMLNLIECALRRRVPAGFETTNIDGQELVRMPIKDLNKLRDYYRREVAAARRKHPFQTHGIRFVPLPGAAGPFEPHRP